MNKIVVATDFSARSDRAIRRAALLASKHGAALALVHVIDDDQPQRIIRAERHAAQSLLDEFARSLREVEGVACETAVVLGDPFAGIVRSGRDLGADVVVLGAHRRELLRDVFVGTTAERAIRTSDRPILMVNAPPAGAYRHILVAVDLSDCSGNALQRVVDLGFGTDAMVSVVHLFDAPGAAAMSRAALSEDQVEDYLAREEERASAELAAFLDAQGARPSHRIVRAKRASLAGDICAVAREASADLVALGSRGRAGIAKLLLGSVAEEVLRVADRDVLVVPPAAAPSDASRAA